jgi:tight adherence protein B
VSALSALCGAGAGLGIALALVGWRGVEAGHRARRADGRWRRVSLRAAVALGVGVLVGAATGWPVAALLAGAGAFALPSLFVAHRAQALAIDRIEAVAGWTEQLRDTMAAAAGLEQAIEATAPVAPLPIRPQVVHLAGRLERERLGPALRAFAAEVADPTCDLVVAALLLAAEHQAGRLGELLGALATAAREQASMRLRVEAGRARTQTSVRLIVGVTLTLVGFLVVFSRSYLSPFDSPLGQFVLLVVGGFFAAAFFWLARMMRPDPQARLLRVEPAPPMEAVG